MAVPRGVLVVALAALLSPALPALAQSDYEARFGEPVDVSLDDLLQGSGQYEGRAVRTSGRLDLSRVPSVTGSRYALRDMYGNSVRLAPVPEVASEFEDQSRFWLGHEIEVTGVLIAESTASSAIQGERHVLRFWAFVGPENAGDPKKPISARDATLESLVTRPGTRDGETVRVVGKFRGRNLYGDLPGASQQKSADWVIKDDMFAVWVTGRKPKGSGWELDTSLKRDTGKWIEVIGRPETRRGVTYLRAIKVSLTSAPSPTADAKAPPPPPPRPKLPPVIVFALPLDGEAGVPPTSRFVVQFNKDMDRTSFAGKVFLRYAGPSLPGDRAFDGVKLTYDDGLRALTVDPGDVLRPGRRLELVLLPGIADIEGLTLVPRPAARAPRGAVEVLRYEIGT
ncbi:MAG TPA: Ig-like domain-containing protein [Gemmatimonadales bacterium]|nr:Ig-like domain-containing protein [Gemmatimonadales bacterium]